MDTDKSMETENMNYQAETFGGTMIAKVDNSENEELKKLIKKAKRKGRLQGAIICFVIMCVLVAGGMYYIYNLLSYNYYAASRLVQSSGQDILDEESYNKINEIYSYIKADYLFDYTEDQVVDGIYSGMLSSLGDEYSVYYTSEEYQNVMSSGQESYCGVGAYLTYDADKKETKIVRPMMNSPAEQAGLIKGDVIVEVNGESVLGMDSDVVSSKVRGEEGTTVHLKIRRGDSDYLEFDIVRKSIVADSVSYQVIDDNIGLISIETFADQTDEEFAEAITRLESQGISSLIIDLRSNGGGFVDSAFNIADRILGRGTVITVKDKAGNEYNMDSDEENKLNLPIVILVDGYTASASEILTGALKDHGVATVIGTQTFGKGIIQDVIELKDGTGIKITSAEYYTPSGANIHGKGITPDIVLEFDADKYTKDQTDNQLEKAKEVLSK